MTGRIRSITTHPMPDLPTPRQQSAFSLNHLILPTWLSPRLLEPPTGGRLVTKLGMTSPLTEYDPEETILAFGSLG